MNNTWVSHDEVILLGYDPKSSLAPAPRLTHCQLDLFSRSLTCISNLSSSCSFFESDSVTDRTAMGSEKQPRQVSDPYEYIISWAKQISNEGGDEQSGEDGDNNRTCAGDEGELDVTSDSGDSVEEIVDIYLDMQRELKQAKAHNPYKQLDEWAKQFDDNQEESIVNQAERKEEEKKNKYAPEPDSTEKRGRPDAVNWINNNDGNSGANTDEHIKNERKIGNDEKKGKQTRCTHSLVNHVRASANFLQQSCTLCIRVRAGSRVCD